MLHKDKRQLRTFNAAAILSVDTLFTWYSEAIHRDWHCRLRIYKITCDKVIVIASAQPDNPEPSMTKEALTLIHLVCHRLALNFNKTMWIEHYPKKSPADEDVYRGVFLMEGRVFFNRTNRQKIEALLGGCKLGR